MALPDDYEEVCRRWTQRLADEAIMPMWMELGLLLGDRPGWRFENDGTNPPAWCFGLEGASRLVVTAGRGYAVLYVHELDEERPFAAVAFLRHWLDEYEQRFEGLTEPQERDIFDDWGDE